MAVPIKPEYGPTLGRLLAPRWRAASPLVRTLVRIGAMAILLALIAAALTLENSTFSHGGRVPFSFSYRDLHRVAADPGGYVKLQQREAHGALQYSFAVNPLTLPPYSGELSAYLPLYVSRYIDAVSRRYPGFELAGEGVTTVNNLPAYDVGYTTLVEGREMYGRDVLVLPDSKGAREGVVIVMLAPPKASKRVKGPLEVATTGVLFKPFKSFSLD
ncbi:MAG TPA: hypothetical protein VKG62_00715 [Solirubrobacteraceae bacterium]|nr:hypothetical protein [Solirubrobacteraceae bacterium]